MKQVTTPQGVVSLAAPTGGMIETMRTLLPFGLEQFAQLQHGAEYGLVMQRGEEELLAVKQQPLDFEEQGAYEVYEANSFLIAISLSAYLGHGFGGLFIPCPYLRSKEGGLIEPGIAYFGYPSPSGREVLEYPAEAAWDGQFGHGFTVMMISFIRALQESSAATGVRLQECIGLDVRRRLQLGRLGFGFAVLGPHVVCLKTVISERDPAWTLLRSKGIELVYHMPSIPLAVGPGNSAGPGGAPRG